MDTRGKCDDNCRPINIVEVAIRELCKDLEFREELRNLNKNWERFEQKYKSFLDREELYYDGLNLLKQGLIQECFDKFQKASNHPAGIIWQHWILSNQFPLKICNRNELKKQYADKIVELYHFLEEKIENVKNDMLTNESLDLFFCKYWCHVSGILGKDKKEESDQHRIVIPINRYELGFQLFAFIHTFQPDAFTKESLARLDSEGHDLTLEKRIIEENILRTILRSTNETVRVWLTQTWQQLVTKKDIDRNPVKINNIWDNIPTEIWDYITTFMLAVDSDIASAKKNRDIVSKKLCDEVIQPKKDQLESLKSGSPYLMAVLGLFPSKIIEKNKIEIENAESRYKKRINF